MVANREVSHSNTGTEFRFQGFFLPNEFKKCMFLGICSTEILWGPFKEITEYYEVGRNYFTIFRYAKGNRPGMPLR